MALCEMILASQLLAGNWSDLHANGVRLLKGAAGSGEIKISFLAPFDSCACVGRRSERVHFVPAFISRLRQTPRLFAP